MIEVSPDQLSSYDIEQRLLKHGALLLRNPENSLANYLTLSQQITQEFVSLSGKGKPGEIGANIGRTPLKGYNDVFVVSTPQNSYPLPLHGEAYFHYATPPNILWFFCVNPAKSGGETLLCDGRKLFEELPSAIKKRLLSEDLVYHRYHDISELERLYGTSNLEKLDAYFKKRGIQMIRLADNTVCTKFRKPAILKHQNKPTFINNLLTFTMRKIRDPQSTRAYVHFPDGTPVPESMILEIYNLSRSLQTVVQWKSQDILILDNRRILHGRDQISAPERKIYLRMGYANGLNAASKSS